MACSEISSSSSGTIIIYRGMFQLTVVLLLSDVVVTIWSSIVALTANGQILGCATIAFSER